MQAIKNILHSRFIVLISIAYLSAQPVTTREYQIKSAFLYNFTQFVEWQQNSFSEQDAPLIIGILGKDPFGKYLDDAVSGEKVNGHPLSVKRYNKIEEVKGCHVLFISSTETDELKEILDTLKHKNILTVSDNSNFLKYGGVIRFFIEKDKIQFQINLEVAKDNNLTMSSKLLRLASIYQSGTK